MSIHSVSVQSRDRDVATFPDANNYEIDFRGTIRGVKEVRLASLEMPLTHMTVEEGENRLHLSEGVQVPCGASADVGGSFDNEFVVAMGGTTYSVAVPAWRNPVTLASDGTTLTATATAATAPHGLAAYNAWKAASAPTAPSVVCVGIPALDDVALDAATATTDDAFEVGCSDTFASVAASIHCPALHHAELASYLTHAFSAHKISFAFRQGVMHLTAPSAATVRPTGIARALGLAGRTGTEIKGVDPASLMAVEIAPGFYDANAFAGAVLANLNLGVVRQPTSFSFVDSEGMPHCVAIAAGRYTPHTLAASIEYQMDRLDVRGIWYNTIRQEYGDDGAGNGATAPSHFVGKVKYRVEYDDATALFTISARRVGAVGSYDAATKTLTGMDLASPVTFGLSFDAAVPPECGLGTPDNASRILGMVGTRDGASSYTSTSPIHFASHASTLEPGLRRYSSYVYTMTGSSTKRFTLHTQIPRGRTEYDSLSAQNSRLRVADASAADTLDVCCAISTSGDGSLPDGPRAYRSTTAPLNVQKHDLVRVHLRGSDRRVLAFVDDLVRSGQTAAAQAADPGNGAAAYAAIAHDGATARLGVSPSIFAPSPPSAGDNVFRLEMGDPSRFEVLVEGPERSGLRRGSIGERLGAREDQWGATHYQMPRQFNLEPAPYITMQLHECGGARGNIHQTETGRRPIFAKLVVSAPYAHNRAQIMERALDGPLDLQRVRVEFLMPDGQPLRTHGRDHSLTLHFVQEGRRPGLHG